MSQRIEIEEFLQLSKTLPIIDVRSPGEFAAGHIPGAHNIPLFTDEQRAMVGTTYKIHGQKKAILQGLEFVGPRMHKLLEEALTILGDRENRILIHCWRGGMRSESVAWLFETYGLKAYLLQGGYKAFRQYVLKINSGNYHIRVLGGYTGSGKTDVLHVLKRQGEQVIDLEGLAHHRGSVYGAIHMDPAPTQEQFENNLADSLSEINRDDIVWMEDESRHIGRIVIPDHLFHAIKTSPLVFLNIPQSQRVRFLVELYGNADRAILKELTLRIEKRLGGLQTKQALQSIDEGNLETAVLILLTYYDRAYEYDVERRKEQQKINLNFSTIDPASIARTLINDYETGN
jgi:tRNA 2-selenouridine synthase